MKTYDGSGLANTSDGTRVEKVVKLLNGAWPWSERLSLGLGPRLRREAQAAFTGSLRRLVDQWIDSGKEQCDTPLNRSVSKIPPGYTQSLRDILRNWYDQSPPGNDVDCRTGEDIVIIHEPSPSEQISLDDDELALVRLKQDADQSAIYWLRQLLNSSDRFRLARCNNAECHSRYYIRRRVRKGEEIKRGTYCRKCVGVASMERTAAFREQQRSKRIVCAADFWEVKPPHRYRRRSDWVAEKVNKSLGLEPIKGKWVTQHKKEIEAEVKRRKMACDK